MKDISFSLKPSEAVSAHQQKGFYLSIRMKGVIVVLLTLLPFIAAGIVITGIWWSNGASAVMTSGTISLSAIFSGVSLSVYCLSLLVLVIFSACIGLVAFEYYFAGPLRKLTKWLQQARDSEYQHVPVLPTMRRDEIGDLTRLLSTSVAQFAQTKDQNVALLQEKSLFMTIAAHQLRTPLTGLLWSIDSLLDPATTEEARHQLLTDIDTLLKRMRLIVNHILASANVEGGKFGYVFEALDIVPIISKLIEEFKPVSDTHGVTLKIEQSEGLFPVYADAERITLALFDLISNAIDYTPRGGSVTVSVKPAGECLEIAVIDTGMGIAESEIPLLFSKFYRSERAKHVRPDGSGLGLFLVKDVIASHGSDVTVTSKEGAGSRFSFCLPSKKPR